MVFHVQLQPCLFCQAKTKGCQSRVDIGVKYADKQQRMFDEEKMKAGQCVIGLQVLELPYSLTSCNWSEMASFIQLVCDVTEVYIGVDVAVRLWRKEQMKWQSKLFRCQQRGNFLGVEKSSTKIRRRSLITDMVFAERCHICSTLHVTRLVFSWTSSWCQVAQCMCQSKTCSLFPLPLFWSCFRC